MKLIIDISEEMYKNIQKRWLEIQVEGYVLENAILNGTPLPKEYGRLIDADALIEKAPEIQEYLDVLADTIIPADKEKE